MPILHNRAYEVYEQIIQLQEDLAELRSNVEDSIRRSDRRAVFCAKMPVEFDYESVKDQIPAFSKKNRITRGTVVAVDYRTEKVTVNCGSVGYIGTEGKTALELVLDIEDVWAARSFDRRYNSDA